MHDGCMQCALDRAAFQADMAIIAVVLRSHACLGLNRDDCTPSQAVGSWWGGEGWLHTEMDHHEGILMAAFQVRLKLSGQ